MSWKECTRIRETEPYAALIDEAAFWDAKMTHDRTKRGW